MTKLFPALAFGGLALLTSCGSPAPEAPPAIDMAALTATIQAMEDAYAAGYTAKDADAVVAYYADDVVSYTKEKEPLRGKAAVRQDLTEGFAKDTLGVKPTYKVTEIFVEGDHLTEIGSSTSTDAAGNETNHGTYFSVFKKNGDGWQCIRDISVSHKPAEKPAPVTQ
ncbi:MAG TPA: nuclear transport factor 2 family protein [Flavobacteriales bacterium]|nr:nuclear transport factor 2 family protein [Flavobacteriales bacterium]